MERSTQGVVQGAKLSDNAGTALTEIDRVSRRLAELIEEITVDDLIKLDSGSAQTLMRNVDKDKLAIALQKLAEGRVAMLADDENSLMIAPSV